MKTLVNGSFVTLALASLLNPLAASADSVCTQGERARAITVVYSNPGQPLPCEVWYEKREEQQTMTLWRAENEVGFCEARAAEFAEKLNGLGWECRDTAAAAAVETAIEPTDEQTPTLLETEE